MKIHFSCSIISAKPVLHTCISEGNHFVVRSINDLSRYDYMMEMLCRDPDYIGRFYAQMLDLDIAFQILNLHIKLNSEDGTSSPIIRTITKLLSRYKVSSTFPPLMFCRGSILCNLESFGDITREDLSLITGDDKAYKILEERLIKQAQNEGYPDSYPFVKKIAYPSIFLIFLNSNGWIWQKRNVSYGRLLSYKYGYWYSSLYCDIRDVWGHILPGAMKYYIDNKDTLGNAISSTLCDLVDYFALDDCERYLLFVEGVIIYDWTFFDEYKKHDWKFLPVIEGVTDENCIGIGLELIKQASSDGGSEAAKYLKRPMKWWRIAL